MQVSAISYLLVFKPAQAATAINALSTLSLFWGVPLAILGVSAYHRGVEKRVQPGEKLNGIVDLIATFKKTSA